MDTNVIEAVSFTAVKHGDYVVLAFESPDHLADLAFTLLDIVEQNEKHNKGFTRYVTSVVGLAPEKFDDSKVVEAIKASDAYVPGRNKAAPLFNLNTMQDISEPGAS
jgi:hypothetical protein